MEADWSVEIGAELPAIVVPWRDTDSGLKFVDLRAQAARVNEISEAQLYPAVGAALLLLNGPQSQVFTSKCDAWRIAADELDALDTDALDVNTRSSETRCAISAYFDILLREAIDFACFELHENWLRRMTAELRGMPLPAAQVEFTMRWAQVEDNEGFATTLHVTGCGRDEASASGVWEAALMKVVALVARGVASQDFPAQASGNQGIQEGIT